jgi:PAS domain-containing protein
MSPDNKRSFGLADVLSVDDFRNVLRSIFYWLFGFCILGSLAFFYTSIPGMQSWVWNALILSFVALIVLFLLRKQNLLLAVSFALAAFGLVLFYIAWTGAGVKGIAYIFNFLIVIGVTLFWGEFVGIITTSLVGLAGLFLLIAEPAGWLVNINHPAPDVFIWACLVASFLISTRMVGVALRHLERAVANSRRELEERTRAEEEIRRLNAELEQRVAERTSQLAESERLLKIIAANVQDVIWTADMQLNTSYLTTAAARLRGFSMEELKNEPLTKALRPSVTS